MPGAGRDDLERALGALTERLEALRARAGEADASRRRELALEEEIAAVRRRLRPRRGERSLLDEVEVASPCTARWEDMVGDD
ncbi:MAG TPA: hypothetical protein VHB21_08090, partial [Minicystis sp.]|nr:hypothetical protein [Minicystis sp.]